MSSSCIFCEILAGRVESSMVYQDEQVAAFMDIQPVNPGHVLVVPIKHAASLGELDPESGRQIFEVGQKVAAAVYKSGLRVEGVNFLLADGEAAGQDVFHVHLHIIPRFAGDGFSLKFAPDYFSLPPHEELDLAAGLIENHL